MNEEKQQFVILHELIEAGLANLDPIARDYLIGGAESEATILRNRAAIDRRSFRPRVLVNVSQLNLKTQILNRIAELPVFLAPIGALHRFHPDGNGAVAAAANRMNLPVFFGSLSRQDPADMRASTQHDAVYQLYIRGDENWVDQRVREVEDLGFDALCLTVDSAVYSRRERDMLRRFEKPWREEYPANAMTLQAAFTWQDIARIRRNCKLPLILKGIAAPEDARLAIEHGIDVVYVSNHGGRQLDHAQGTLDSFVAIKEVISGQTKLFVDGGFMRGTDILKAVALGADAVGLGRIYCFALAAGGQNGVFRMLQILKNELETALALIGASSLPALSHHFVVDEKHPPSRSHLLSGFPLMKEGAAREGDS